MARKRLKPKPASAPIYTPPVPDDLVLEDKEFKYRGYRTKEAAIADAKKNTSETQSDADHVIDGLRLLVRHRAEQYSKLATRPLGDPLREMQEIEALISRYEKAKEALREAERGKFLPTNDRGQTRQEAHPWRYRTA